MIDPPPIAAAFCAGASGAGQIVAVIDSGVSFAHPHLGLPARGWAVLREGREVRVEAGDHGDRFGHGTCCAALIHALAPGAALWAIRVMADRPATDAERVARAIQLAVEEGATIACAPLGTHGSGGRWIDDAVAAAAAAGVWVVAPLPEPADTTVRPGASPGALGVAWTDGVDVAVRDAVVVADGRPRPIGGLSANFRGPSLSAARAAAALARWSQEVGTGVRNADALSLFKSTLPLW